MESKMNRIKSLILIMLTVLICPQKSYTQESADSTVRTLSPEVNLPDSVLRLLAENVIQIDSLTGANSALKGLLREAQQESEVKTREITSLKRKIDDLQNITIRRLEASNDTLQRRLISMASNFLYIPYDEYSIEEIAIPAFLSTNGTSAYVRYQNRLPLLQNYKSDVSSLVKTISQIEKDLEIGLTAMRNQKANEHLNNIQTSPIYQRYTSYDDWENTYLGGQLQSICGLLKSPTEQTASKLKTIRTNLEKLLNNN